MVRNAEKNIPILGPSLLTFLYSECPACFYNQVKKISVRPRTPMPKIFTHIDGLCKVHFEGKKTQHISSLLPKGNVYFGDKWVQSKILTDSKSGRKCIIKGKTDTVIKFDNGEYGIVDFKTGFVKAENIEFYSKQLHAYAFALEHAAYGKPQLFPITKLGLLVTEPDSMSTPNEERFSFNGKIIFQEIKRDDEKFKSFLREVLAILYSEKPPKPSGDCHFCDYKGLIQ